MWVNLDPIKKDPLLFRRIPLLFLFNDIPLPLCVIPFVIMVSASLRSTTFLLVFIWLPLRFSSAHTQHQGKKTLVVTNIETASPVEIYHGVSAVAETDRGTRYPSGRKMMSRIVFSKVEEAENGTNVAKNLTTKWNHEEGKGILNVKQHKVGKRNSGHSKKANMSALVPLNADYYVPRPHPPKNN